jgi:hypothetical protein
MTLRQKLRAIVRCEELCRQYKEVKLQITDDADFGGPEIGKKPLAQDASLDNLDNLRAGVSKAMKNKKLLNCASAGNSIASRDSGMFYLFAVYS